MEPVPEDTLAPPGGLKRARLEDGVLFACGAAAAMHFAKKLEARRVVLELTLVAVVAIQLAWT